MKEYNEQVVETLDDAGCIIANKNIIIDNLQARIAELEEENARLKAVAEHYEKQLEVERMRLVACDVAATGNFDSCNDEYKSAALTSVLSLRERAAKLEEDLDLSITRDATINLLKQTLVKLFDGVASAPVGSGICCCGDDMTKHPSAFSCGHTPVDMWDNYLSGWCEEIDKLVGGMSNVQLDSDSDNGRPVQLRELDGSLEVGQLLGNGQNQETSHSKTVGDVILTDTFRGDDSALIDSIVALVSLDRAGVLVPHGIGGHARSLLESAAIRLSQPDRTAELEAALKVARYGIDKFLVANDPTEFGCACDLSVGYLCGPCHADKQQQPLKSALAKIDEVLKP